MTDNKKAKRLSKEEIKTKLWDSINVDEIVEFDQRSPKIEDPEKAGEIVKRYQDIIKTKNKGIINVHITKHKFLKGLWKRKSLPNSSVN